METMFKQCWRIVLTYLAIYAMVVAMFFLWHHVDMARRSQQQTHEVTK